MREGKYQIAPTNPIEVVELTSDAPAPRSRLKHTGACQVLGVVPASSRDGRPSKCRTLLNSRCDLKRTPCTR